MKIPELEKGRITTNHPNRSFLHNRICAITTAIVVAIATVTTGCKITDAPIAKKESAAKAGIPAEKRQQAEVLIRQILERYRDEPLLCAHIQSLRQRLEYLFSPNFADDAKRAGLEPREIQAQLFADLESTLKNPEKLLPEEILRKQLFAEISPHLSTLVDQYTEECKARKKRKEKEENPHTERLKILIDTGNGIVTTLLRNNFDPHKIRQDIAAFKRDADEAMEKNKANTVVRFEK